VQSLLFSRAILQSSCHQKLLPLHVHCFLLCPLQMLARHKSFIAANGLDSICGRIYISKQVRHTMPLQWQQ
jgi:hypothetical protein